MVHSSKCNFSFIVITLCNIEEHSAKTIHLQNSVFNTIIEPCKIATIFTVKNGQEKGLQSHRAQTHANADRRIMILCLI